MAGFFYKDIRKSYKMIFTILALFLSFAGALFFVAAITKGDQEASNTLLFSVATIYCCCFLMVDWAVKDSYLGEEETVWINFVMSTPQTMKAQIQAKFCLTLFYNICMFMLCSIVDAISCMIYGDLSISASVVAFMLACFNLLKSAISFPFVYLCGVKYGNTMKEVFILVLFFFAMLYGLFGNITWILGGNVVDKVKQFFMNGNGIWIVGLFPYVSAGLFFVSYLLCLKLYRKELDRNE